jgi:hypothetical protein
MGKLILPIALVFLFSCNETSKNEPLNYNEKNEFDTLYINEDMRGNYGFNLKFDSLTNEKHIPRNVWIKVCVEGRDTMFHILKHADLYLTSRDSNFQIQRITKNEYKFFVNNNYQGYIPNGGPVKEQECLEIYPNIQPNEGYVLSTYWLDNPIKYPKKTNVLVMYQTLQEVK